MSGDDKEKTTAAEEDMTLEEKVEYLGKQLEEAQEAILHVQTTTQNRIRRVDDDAGKAKKFAVQKFAVDMLSLADSFDRAIEALPEDTDAGVKAGMETTRSFLTCIFNKHGIFEVESAGQKFDPKRHEALMEIPSPDMEPGTVADVARKCYRMYERIIRTAQVAIVAGGNKKKDAAAIPEIETEAEAEAEAEAPESEVPQSPEEIETTVPSSDEEDSSTTPVVEAGEEEQTSPAAEKEMTLEEKVEYLGKQLAEAQEIPLRVQAAAQNYIRGVEGNAEKAKKFAVRKFATDMLGLADKFDSAIQALPEDTDEGVRTGMETMRSFLTGIFNKHGISEIGDAGERFNPELHENVKQVPSSEDLEPGTVADVTRKGYMMGERPLRLAQVSVVVAADTAAPS